MSEKIFKELILIDNILRTIQNRDCEKFIELCNNNLSDNIANRVKFFQKIHLPPEEFFELKEIVQPILLPPEEIFEFKDKFLKVKYPNNSLIYELEYSIFMSGMHSPERIFDILTYGTEQKQHAAYALRAIMYDTGCILKIEDAINDIKTAISLQPDNNIYKKILNILLNTPECSNILAELES